MTYVFYNPLAGAGACKQDVEILKSALNGNCVICDMTKSKTYEDTLFSLKADDVLILCGGDGTLNRFINLVQNVEIPCEIMYFPSGSGNDFAKDLGKVRCDDPFPITKYLKNLPYVTVNGKTCRFLNGIGYGIDGYCCEVGDEVRKKSTKPVNYTMIAIKGLLFHYKPTRATVTVDGVSKSYEHVWLVPTMNGKYYGGGMIPTPAQNRLENDTLSAMVYHSKSKIRALMIFPSIFKGEHIKHTKNVEILTGKEITVEYDRPTALQIDGETVLGVTSYTAQTCKVYEESHIESKISAKV